VNLAGLRRGSEAARAATVERLARLVELESPSGDVARLAALADVLAARLTDLGAAIVGGLGLAFHRDFNVAGRGRLPTRSGQAVLGRMRSLAVALAAEGHPARRGRDSAA